MKELIDKYKVHGKVYAWKYKDNNQNYPGWNFTGDLKGSESLCGLFNLMISCKWSIKKKISLELPTKLQLNVPNNQNGIAKWKSKPNLILNYNTCESANYWLINEFDNAIEIQFGKEKLTELQNAINRISRGIGDFAISDLNKENILYFWWNLES